MAADFSLKDDEVPVLSGDFETLLGAMTKDSGEDRPSLTNVMEVSKTDIHRDIEGGEGGGWGYIYIYRERERGRERKSVRVDIIYICMYVCMYISCICLPRHGFFF